MSKEPSASQVARAQRMKIAAEEGAKVRTEIQANDIAVRKNMERLRALRLAREAEEAEAAPEPSAPAPRKSAGKAKASSRTASKATPKTAAKLADWMKAQDGSGRKL